VRVARVIKPRPGLWSITTHAFTTVAGKMESAIKQAKGCTIIHALYESNL
jgi:hypothetical protein